MASQVIEADLTWTGRRFEPSLRVAVDAEGRIEAVGDDLDEPTLRLHGGALLPGFVNAHSHAFQGLLCGRGEHYPDGAGDFWSWREAMYGLVDELDEDGFRSACHHAFTEMRREGITTVGEFHYLHHVGDETDFDLDAVILEAASEVGIRLVLLNTLYVAGGFAEPLQGTQRRFDGGSLEGFLAHTDSLAQAMDPSLQTMGLAAHSMRAVPIDLIQSLYEASMERGWTFHMHLEEQPAEIEACLAAHGRRPMAIVNERLEVTHRLTAVHCTHTANADLDEYLEAGGNVCLCPITEANLGDGFASVRRILRGEGCIAMGTDSNDRLSMLEAIRWLELGQRACLGRRGVCRDDAGDVAGNLLRFATEHGARSLGLKAGRIAKGHVADFTLIDIQTPPLAGCDVPDLAPAMVFGADARVIAGTCVAGRWSDDLPG